MPAKGLRAVKNGDRDTGQWPLSPGAGDAHANLKVMKRGARLGKSGSQILRISTSRAFDSLDWTRRRVARRSGRVEGEERGHRVKVHRGGEARQTAARLARVPVEIEATGLA